MTLVTPGKPSLRLVNLLEAEPGSATHALACLLARLDSLAHVLAWQAAEPAAAAASAVSLVELPRLRLSFAASGSASGSALGRLECGELSGLHLFFGGLPGLPPSVVRLMRGLPHAVVLEGKGGELQLLVPATAKPVLPVPPSTPLGGLALDRNDAEWNGAIGQVPWVYPSPAFSP